MPAEITGEQTTGARRPLTEELRRVRDDLIYDLRSGVRSRQGHPPLRTVEVAAIFRLSREHSHAIIRRASRRRERELIGERAAIDSEWSAGTVIDSD